MIQETRSVGDACERATSANNATPSEAASASGATPNAGNFPADVSALAAMSEAQKIAFAPMLFHAVGTLLETGLLAFLDKRGTAGASVREAAEQSGLSEYAVAVLLEAAAAWGVVLEGKRAAGAADSVFAIGKTGRFLLNDPMTRANFDFVRDVCYAGMPALTESVRTGRPAGLRVFGDWKTIYPALSALPEPAKSSWFAFDHFYSDSAFGAALPHVFALRPAHIYDVGGNTGKWALRCVAYDSDVRVTVLDLPEQVALLRQHTAGKLGAERISAHPVDMLAPVAQPLLGDADVWWMSQFLDCFSAEQVTAILTRIRAALKPGARVCILEPFRDAQKFAAGRLSLAAGSLYFTCLANGNSRFYDSAPFIALIAAAGLRVERRIDDLGSGAHTLLVCAPQ